MLRWSPVMVTVGWLVGGGGGQKWGGAPAGTAAHSTAAPSRARRSNREAEACGLIIEHLEVLEFRSRGFRIDRRVIDRDLRHIRRRCRVPVIGEPGIDLRRRLRVGEKVLARLDDPIDPPACEPPDRD